MWTSVIWRVRLAIRSAMATHRGKLKRAALAVLVILLAVFIGLALYDIAANRGRRQVETFLNPASSLYQAIVRLDGLRFEPASGLVTVNATYSIVGGAATAPDVGGFLLAYQRDAGGSNWTYYDSSNPGYTTGETGEGFPKAGISEPRTFVTREVRRGVYYPFDEYSFELSPRACVNSRDLCADVVNAREIDITMNEQHLFISDDFPEGSGQGKPIRYALQRSFFVRWVSIWVSAFLFIFLLYLIGLGDLKDLLPKAVGYFGTMWAFRQLIVPSAITIFPTAMDYYILMLFGILFIVVTYRVALEKLGGD
jgi:hypothetical protein